jgi:hypothetical protein
MLGLFVGELDLEQDGKAFAEFGGGGVEPGGDFKRIDGVDCMEDFGCFGGLVGLQRADEMELCTWQRGCGGLFLLELLNAVFAEEALPGGMRATSESGRPAARQATAICSWMRERFSAIVLMLS